MKLPPKLWDWDTVPAGSWLQECRDEVPLVWLAWLPRDRDKLAYLASLLSAAEHTRLERLRREEDRQRFLAGRGWLRLFLGAHWNLPAAQVEFTYGPSGKPSAVRPATAAHPGTEPVPGFNVSHSGQLVLLAFHPSREVGVDVEQVRPSRDHEAIARRMFSPTEYDRWSRLKPEEQGTGFFQAWTRHEASLKALGRGLAEANENVPWERVRCFDLDLPEGYAGAVGWVQHHTNNGNRA